MKVQKESPEVEFKGISPLGDRSVGWPELILNMISTNELDLTFDVQKSTIKLSSKNVAEIIELVLKFPERVQILVDGNVQADITFNEALQELYGKIEGKALSRGKINRLLRGRNRNFFATLVIMITLLKLASLQKAVGSKQVSRRVHDRKYEIDPYL